MELYSLAKLGAIVAYKLNKSLPYFFFVFLKLKVSLSLHVLFALSLSHAPAILVLCVSSHTCLTRAAHGPIAI